MLPFVHLLTIVYDTNRTTNKYHKINEDECNQPITQLLLPSTNDTSTQLQKLTIQDLG
ncbi:hypothetical protein D3C84_1190740 [compost metagenome]